MKSALRSLVLAADAITPSLHATEVFSSWNDKAAKQAITRFVAAVTTPGSPGFVPGPERMAVFDNDGALWAERPMHYYR